MPCRLLHKSGIGILLANGVSPEEIEFDGYKRHRLNPNGFCALFENGKCRFTLSSPRPCGRGQATKVRIDSINLIRSGQ